MKPAFFFFLCFSFLLLSGSSHIGLSLSLKSSHSLLINLSKSKQQVKPVSQIKNSFVLFADAGEPGDTYLNALEPEDTDDENSRFLEWSSYFLRSYYHLLSGNIDRHRKDRLPTCPHFALLASDKYLTYRVIRI